MRSEPASDVAAVLPPLAGLAVIAVLLAGLMWFVTLRCSDTRRELREAT